MKAKNKRFWLLWIALLVGAGIDHIPAMEWYWVAIISLPIFFAIELLSRNEVFWT